MTEVPPQPDLSPLERPPRALFVRLAVFSAIAITLLTIGVVGVRWFTVRFPDSAMVVASDAKADGVEVVVHHEATGHEIARGLLVASNGYRFIVLLEQGSYIVRARWGDQTVLESRVYVPRAGVEVTLRMPPGLGPATTRSSEIQGRI